MNEIFMSASTRGEISFTGVLPNFRTVKVRAIACFACATCDFARATEQIVYKSRGTSEVFEDFP